jgi:hypothetical protein
MTPDTLSNGHYSGSVTPKGPASSGCVVQKFGGTSVGKFALEMVTNVIKPSLVKDHVAVVCSAVSATVKADGTTNRWVSAFSILEMSPADRDSDYCRPRKKRWLLDRTVSVNSSKMFGWTILPSPTRTSRPRKYLPT